MALSDPRHPIWGLAKGFVAVGTLATILFFSASRFDNSEIEVIGWFAIIYGIIQGSHELLKGRR